MSKLNTHMRISTIPILQSVADLVYAYTMTKKGIPSQHHITDNTLYAVAPAMLSKVTVSDESLAAVTFKFSGTFFTAKRK